MKAYAWSVERLDCLPETEIVVQVHWRCTASEGACSASVAGATAFPAPAPEQQTTPYDELTLEQVIGWVKAQLGDEAVDAVEADLANQIEAQASPPVISPALPWGS